ncbi:tail protein X [Brucella sp. TWI432]
MTARLIPAGRFLIDAEDMTLDLACFQYAYRWLGNRKQAGKLGGFLEATYEANPGLAELGLILPLGTTINMPEFTISTEVRTVRLWS